MGTGYLLTEFQATVLFLTMLRLTGGGGGRCLRGGGGGGRCLRGGGGGGMR
jgi:hypothetical protein